MSFSNFFMTDELTSVAERPSNVTEESIEAAIASILKRSFGASFFRAAAGRAKLLLEAVF